MYIETSLNISGDENVFVSCERKDFIQISNITFYYNRFSNASSNPGSIGRLRIQLFILNGHWHSNYIINKNTNYSSTPTKWSLLTSDFTERNYGIKLIYDEIYTALTDACFSNIMITRSVY